MLLCSSQADRPPHDEVPAKARKPDKAPQGQVLRRPVDEVRAGRWWTRLGQAGGGRGEGGQVVDDLRAGRW